MGAAAKKASSFLSGGDEPDEESEPTGDDESDTGALAGTAFAQAIESGDGARIFKAFGALLREHDESEAPSEKGGVGLLIGVAKKKPKE